MRIMIDTNILLSALVFRSTKMADMIDYIVEKHTLVICSYVIEEFKNVVTRKSLKYKNVIDVFLSKLSFEMVYTPEWKEGMPTLRDEKDKPILASAITADVDMLITGDKDFLDVDIERPEIMTPSEFLEQYV